MKKGIEIGMRGIGDQGRGRGREERGTKTGSENNTGGLCTTYYLFISILWMWYLISLEINSYIETSQNYTQRVQVPLGGFSLFVLNIC